MWMISSVKNILSVKTTEHYKDSVSDASVPWWWSDIVSFLTVLGMLYKPHVD